MRARRDIESKLREFRKRTSHTDYDLGQISMLTWILEDWDWEEKERVLLQDIHIMQERSKLGDLSRIPSSTSTEAQGSKAPVH